MFNRDWKHFWAPIIAAIIAGFFLIYSQQPSQPTHIASDAKQHKSKATKNNNEEFKKDTLTTTPKEYPKTNQTFFGGNQESKKIGNSIVTIKKLSVSNGKLTVFLDFFNESDKESKLGRLSSAPKPSLTDDNGNTFRYSDGLRDIFLTRCNGSNNSKWITLAPKLHTDVVLYFRPETNTTLEDIGTFFDFSMKFSICNPKNDHKSGFSIAFSDIKAAKPKKRN